MSKTSELVEHYVGGSVPLEEADDGASDLTKVVEQAVGRSYKVKFRSLDFVKGSGFAAEYELFPKKGGKPAAGAEKRVEKDLRKWLGAKSVETRNVPLGDIGSIWCTVEWF